MSPRGLALVGAVVAAALLPAPSTAATPDTVINFDALPVSTLLSTQYEASDGVTFGKAADFGIPGDPPQCTPRVTGTGISGRSAEIYCSANEFNAKFGVAFEFEYERRAVSFRLRQGVRGETVGGALIQVYGIGAVLLEQRTLALAYNVVNEVSIVRGSSQIAAIVISGVFHSAGPGGVQLDDIVAPRDDVPPPPKYALALGSPSVDVVEGTTTQAPVSVRRFNGSTGPVTLGVAELPPGITAAQVDPNPLTGKNAGALRITAAGRLEGSRQISVTASGGGPAGAAVVSQLVQTVRGVPALTLAEGSRFSLTLVPGCGTHNIDEFVGVRGGFRGVVRVTARRISGGVVASVSVGTIAVNGTGSYPFRYDVAHEGPLGPGEIELELTAVGGSPTVAGTPVKIRRVTRTDSVRIDRTLPGTVRRAGFGQPTSVAVDGNFPPACAIQFQDSIGQAYTITGRDHVVDDGPPYHRIFLTAPTTAVSGALRALSRTGIELARSALDVTDFRNTFALPVVNGGTGAGSPTYTWDDFVRTFGRDDAYACFIVCVRDPIAVDHWERYRASVQSGRGLCFGWATMALRFLDGLQRPSDYLPDATRAWQIADVSDGTPAKRDVVRWQISQMDKSFAEHGARQSRLSAGEVRKQLRDLLNERGAALITLREGSRGHAVVAYDMVEPLGPSGVAYLSVYDPNLPYSAAEEMSAATRTGALNTSQLLLRPDGGWRGVGYSGGVGALIPFQFLPKADAKLPSEFSIASLVTASGTPGGDAAAKVTAIRTGAHNVLLADGSARPGSGVTPLPLATGAGDQPQYRLAPGREYELLVRGSSAGEYRHGLLGGGATASVSGARTAPGQQDSLTVRPGEAALSFEGGGSPARIEYDLAEVNGRVTRSATVATRPSRGGADDVQLDGGVLRLRHDGAATTATITLGSVGEGLPGAVTTTPLPLRPGQRLELRPRDWRDLATGVQMVVRNRAGRVVRRGGVRLRPSAAVALGALKVGKRRFGGALRLTVTGSVTRRGREPVLGVTAELLRGSRVVKRRTVTRVARVVKAGRFTLPLTLTAVPRGAHVRVRALLIDDASDMASARRVVRLRG